MDFNDMVRAYKAWLKLSHNKDERYKWEIVKFFQENLDIETQDFASMLRNVLARAGNLIYANSASYVRKAAQLEPEEVRSLFRLLYDESKPLDERMDGFVAGMKALEAKVTEETGSSWSHQQDERTMALYLALRYPEKHYFYKYSFYKKLCVFLHEPEEQKGRRYQHFCKQADRIKQEYGFPDKDVMALHRDCLTPLCFSGDETNLVLQNFLYRVFDLPESLRLRGETSRDATSLRDVFQDLSPDVRFWAYMPGNGASMADMCFEENIIVIPENGLGDLRGFADKEALRVALRNQVGDPESSLKNQVLMFWQFARDMKPGDIVFMKRGLSEVLGMGVVDSEYRYESDRGEISHVRSVRWLDRTPRHFGQRFATKMLTDITSYSEYVEGLKRLYAQKRPEGDPQAAAELKCPNNIILFGPPGTGKTFRTTEMALAIVEGRPFEAYRAESREEIRRRYNEARENGFIEFVTFHQSFSYEDFVEGIRPSVFGGAVVYEVRDGVFKALACVPGRIPAGGMCSSSTRSAAGMPRRCSAN